MAVRGGMFGHDDDDDKDDKTLPDPVADGSLGVTDSNSTVPPVPSMDDSTDTTSSDDDADDSPVISPTTAADPEEDLLPAHASGSDDNSDADSPGSDKAPDSDNAGTDDLLNIKQQALGQLSPLVSHLDQSPEERFRTIMMMIQAADNQSLINDAYEAAQKITDEKTKAQALLDVVNEINYFTQHQNLDASK